MSKKIYLNSLGLINALGMDKASIWANLLLAGKRFLSLDEKLIPNKKAFVGKVSQSLAEIPESLQQFENRNNQLLLAAFKQVEADYKKLAADLNSSRIAIILGTSTGAMDDAELQLSQHLKGSGFDESYHFLNQEIGGGDEFLASYLGLQDSIHYTVSTACSSSAKALVAAKYLIENDMADLVIAGGADSLCKLTLNGFNALESLSKSICKPFSDNRDGINIGEGAALFLVSKQPAGVSLLGAGETSDAHHMSAPDPQATGAINAMQQALTQANLSAEQIDYLNLHGTATIKNDEMEAKAVVNVFADSRPFVSSTKHLTGHMLGAAGASEIGFCWLALQNESEGRLPLNQPDTGTEFSALNFVTQAPTKNVKISHCMSNSFAFGGNNISVILSKETN
ncbi:MAG: beta-ketoacyl-ACP synthase [Gammaproteobacteria bacterium]|nr:beta-ketoacyl-ACP synthase [Gammaproteobacteria bacterium]